MKFACAGGHSKKAQGASCYINEYTEDRKVNKALIAALKARGHSAVDCSNEKSPSAAELKEECRLANASKADVFVATHFNACSKTSKEMGVEVWYYKGSTKGKAYAEKVAKELSAALDLPNRGAKATTSLYVLKNTSMTAILVEVCFVDSKADANAYKELGAEKVAEAIATGLTGTKAATKTTIKATTTKKAAKSYKVKITASVLNVRAGAGTKYKVTTTVKKNQVYTIVQESNGWGKLKSGAGWIKLSYTKKV